jgi:tripartite ATP-independent transporter DctP family solute receptor
VPLVPDFGALGMPFVYRDFDHVYKTVSGPIGDDLSKKLEAKGIIVAAWLENGFRHITNNRGPVNGPDDLKNMKIRTLRSRPCMALFEACGATVANITFSELYSALQLGTVEAQENPFPNIYDRKFYEVQKYLSTSGHIHTSEPLIMSKVTFDKLTAEEKEYFTAAGKEVTRQALRDAEAAANDYRSKLEGSIAINTVDPEAFAAVTAQVYAQLPEYAALANRIKEVR